MHISVLNSVLWNMEQVHCIFVRLISFNFSCLTSAWDLKVTGLKGHTTRTSYEHHGVSNHWQLNCLFNSFQANHEENIKALQTWNTVSRIHLNHWIPLTKGQECESLFISWCLVKNNVVVLPDFNRVKYISLEYDQSFWGKKCYGQPTQFVPLLLNRAWPLLCIKFCRLLVWLRNTEMRWARFWLVVPTAV